MPSGVSSRRGAGKEVFHHTGKAYDLEGVVLRVPDSGTGEDIFIDEREGAFLAEFIAARGKPVEKIAFEVLEGEGVRLGQGA